MSVFRGEVERLFECLTRPAGGRPAGEPWVPPADVFEDAAGYRLELDLPGVRHSDIAISAEGGVLQVDGEREGREAPSLERCRVRERSTGRFARSFRLPGDADTRGIQARLRDGVLTIEIPRRG